MHSLMKTPCFRTYEFGIQMQAGVTAASKQQRKGSVNSYRFQTTREVILSALFKRQLSGSQLSSRWDKNVLSFKPFCSTGAVHQFSHLHSRGDKGLAGKFIFASGYKVLLSLYQPEMKQVYKARRFQRLFPRKDGNEQGTPEEPAGWGSRSCLIPPPTATLLNPILCYWLVKSIGLTHKHRGRCWNAAIHSEVTSGIRFWSTKRIHPALLHGKCLLLIKKKRKRPHMIEA